MAYTKVCDGEKLDAELSNVANAVRDKNPNANQMDFYAGDFAKEIRAIPQEGSVIDSTLTQAGQAADAKAVGDKLGELNRTKVSTPAIGTIGQVLAVKTVDGSGKPTEFEAVDQTGGEKPKNYEKVGETPFVIPCDDYLVRPTVQTKLFTKGGVENLILRYTEAVPGWADPDCEFTIDGNMVTISKTKETGGIGPIVVLKGLKLEVGEYTIHAETVDYDKKTTSTYVKIGGSASYDNSWETITVKNAGTFDCNIANFGTAAPPPPLKVKIYLFRGRYTSMPPTGQSIEIIAQENRITSLNPFRGQTVYSDPTPIDVFQYKEESREQGGTLICFGDSLTRTSKYPERLTEMGMSAINLGVSGSQLTGDTTYSMVHVVDAIKAGDMSEQINAGDNPNYKSVLSLLASSDGIVLEYGTNDYNQNKVFTGPGKDTLEGGLTYVLTELFKLYPAHQIYFISTFPYTWWTADKAPDNTHGTIKEMNDVLRGVCTKFGVPFLDMYNNYCMNDQTRLAISSDGLHPNNEVGRSRYSKMIFGMLKALGR